MTDVLVWVAYSASAMTLAALGVAVVRRGRLTTAGLALLALIVATLVWLVEAGWGLAFPPADRAPLLAWTMVAAALAVAAIRILVRAAGDASWRATPLTVLPYGVHPVAVVMVAVIPGLRALVVVANADGTVSYGPVFWVHAVVAYLLLSGAILEMLGARDRIPFLAKFRPVTMIVAWALPLAINLSLILLAPVGAADMTPIALTLTVGVLYLTVLRGGFSDLSPIARAEVFEQLVDAVFVTDTRGNLVDTNEKARRLAGLDEQPVHSPHISLQEACPAIARVVDTPGEHDVVIGAQPLVLDIAISHLTDERGRHLGRAVRARDITQSTAQRRELARIHNALAREASANEQLRAELADQALRDVGTGLHNRRYVMQLLPELVARCERDGLALAIALIDLDHFKVVNDTWGHSVGDRVLEAAAKAMESVTPPGMIARFGGEEFIALWPGLTVQEAAARADAIRAACAGVEVRTREGVITVTASAGVASSPPGDIDADALIDAADAALYRAKDADRDRTWVASSH